MHDVTTRQASQILFQPAHANRAFARHDGAEGVGAQWQLKLLAATTDCEHSCFKRFPAILIAFHRLPLQSELQVLPSSPEQALTEINAAYSTARSLLCLVRSFKIAKIQ